jgi:hypothetical protein
VLTAEELKTLLKLEPLPQEGGYFAETYRSAETAPAAALPARFRGPRSFGTAIYYMLTADTFSALHRLRSDEVYHFYLGDPVELLILRPESGGEVVTLGPDLAAGQRVQFGVPAGAWQGSRLVAGGKFALLGTTMAPGWDPADFELGSRAALLAACPHRRDLIQALTRA